MYNAYYVYVHIRMYNEHCTYYNGVQCSLHTAIGNQPTGPETFCTQFSDHLCNDTHTHNIYIYAQAVNKIRTKLSDLRCTDAQMYIHPVPHSNG